MKSATVVFFAGMALASGAWAFESYQTEEEAAAYNQSMCQQSYAENCINMICVNNDSQQAQSPHCTQDCNEEAAAKCANLQQ